MDAKTLINGFTRCALIAAVFVLIARLTTERHYQPHINLQIIERLLRPGDIVFRRGRSMESEFVINAKQDSRYSHAGIVVERGGQLLIAHAAPSESPEEGDVARLTRISDFFAPERATNAAIYRLNSSNQIESDRSARSASLQAKHMADLAIPFGLTFDANSNNSVYCTEFIRRAYALAGVDLAVHPSEVNIASIKRTILLPEDLTKSPKLSAVASGISLIDIDRH